MAPRITAQCLPRLLDIDSAGLGEHALGLLDHGAPVQGGLELADDSLSGTGRGQLEHGVRHDLCKLGHRLNVAVIEPVAPGVDSAERTCDDTVDLKWQGVRGRDTGLPGTTVELWPAGVLAGEIAHGYGSAGVAAGTARTFDGLQVEELRQHRRSGVDSCRRQVSVGFANKDAGGRHVKLVSAVGGDDLEELAVDAFLDRRRMLWLCHVVTPVVVLRLSGSLQDWCFARTSWCCSAPAVTPPPRHGSHRQQRGPENGARVCASRLHRARGNLLYARTSGVR